MFALRHSIASRGPRRRLSALAALMTAATLLGGCVTAESSRYQGAMNRSVKPQSTASADVAGAFGLRDGNGATVSLATAGDH